jgi:hypothetical protein
VVKIRELEPTGLIKLAQAQMHVKDWNGAKATIAKLRAKTWPERFVEAPKQIKALEAQFDAERPPDR